MTMETNPTSGSGDRLSDWPEGLEYAPLETREQASALPAVRAIYAEFAASPGQGLMDAHNARLITSACDAAGVELGAFDRRIVAWLSKLGADDLRRGRRAGYPGRSEDHPAAGSHAQPDAGRRHRLAGAVRSLHRLRQAPGRALRRPCERPGPRGGLRLAAALGIEVGR